MEIYSLKEEYIQYLQKFDNRVCVSKLNQAFGRKYVGVVFQINDVVYFAPLSSKQKERHFTDVLLFDNKSQLGSVKINNMVPVPKKYKDQLITPVIINEFLNSRNEASKRYGNLLKKQQQVLFSTQVSSSIRNKATNFYIEYKNKPLLQKLCCDFKLLEQKALEFSLDIFKDLNKEFKLEKKKEKSKELEEELVR